MAQPHYIKEEQYHDSTLRVETILSTGISVGTHGRPADTHTVVLKKDGSILLENDGIKSEELIYATNEMFKFGEQQIDGIPAGTDPNLVRLLLNNGFTHDGESTYIPPYDPVTSGLFIAGYSCFGGNNMSIDRTNAPNDGGILGFVAQLTDLTGNGNHMVPLQSNTENRPVLKVVNGVYKVVLSGVQTMQVPNFPLGANCKGVTVFGVLKQTQSNIGPQNFIGYSTDSGFATAGFLVDFNDNNASDNLLAYSVGENGAVSRFVPMDAGVENIICASFSRTDRAPQVDVQANANKGGTTPSGNVVNNNDFAQTAPLVFGSHNGTERFCHMEWKELWIANKELTPAEIQTHKDYLRAIYPTA